MESATLKNWFEHVHEVLETAYLSHVEPWRQSGMSGPEERWISLRKPVADCIDHDGSLLDIGCANGYLLECCLRWTGEREIRIEPFGLDVSERLVALARARLPQHAANFSVGNAFYWQPPQQYDVVRTELVYVPAELERDFILRLVSTFLKSGGRLLIANYAEGLPDPERTALPGCFTTNDIMAHLSDLGFAPDGYKDGYDPIKDRKVRIAFIDKPVD